LTSFACATRTNTANRTSQLDDVNWAAALSKLGVTGVGTRADGDHLVTTECAVSEGDAVLVAKTMRRLVRDDIAKTYCPKAHALIKDLGRPDSALVGRIYCAKFAIKTADVKCE
jgi:hypothetical protein